MADPKPAPNPNPARITDAEWWFWLAVRLIIAGVRYGGQYVDKQCYHGTRRDNEQSWPGAYCIRLLLDLRGPSDKSAATDLTMSDAEMRRRTRYLRDSALDPDDDRLWALREFYGTLDSKTVYGLIKDDEDGPWQESSADDTHLWHQHLSWFRAFVADWDAFEPVLSVLSGESYAQWKARKAEDDMDLSDKIELPDGRTWTVAGVLKWAYHHSAKARAGLTDEVLPRLAALEAAVAGEDVAAAVAAQLAEHRAMLAAELRAEVADVLDRRAELGADAVVDELVARLASGDGDPDVGES